MLSYEHLFMRGTKVTGYMPPSMLSYSPQGQSKLLHMIVYNIHLVLLKVILARVYYNNTPLSNGL